MKRFTFKKLIPVLLLSGLFACHPSSKFYWVEGGESTFKKIYSSSSLNQNFNEWCKLYNVSPVMKLPIKYPKNPGELLKAYSPKKFKYFPGSNNGSWLNKYINFDNPSAEQWRHSIFTWNKHLAKTRIPEFEKRNLYSDHWIYNEGLYDSLPLDGSYTAYFINVFRGEAMYRVRRMDYYVRVIVDPDMKIVAVSDTIGYPINGKALKNMKKLGVFIW